jgi:hypothetical protein
VIDENILSLVSVIVNKDKDIKCRYYDFELVNTRSS